MSLELLLFINVCCFLRSFQSNRFVTPKKMKISLLLVNVYLAASIRNGLEKESIGGELL
jgi:hypothetical protein